MCKKGSGTMFTDYIDLVRELKQVKRNLGK